MNSASVFKNQGIINEKVRIPESPLEEDTPQDEPLSPEALSDDSFDEGQPPETDAELTSDGHTLNNDTGDENAAAEELFQEPEPEPEPEPPFPSREELCELYEQQLAELCTTVAEQAYYDAFSRKKAQLKSCIAQVKELTDALAESHRQFIDEYTEELKYMAIEIAEKMILEKIQEDDLILQRLVMHSVKSVKNAEWLNLEISERLVKLVDVMKTELEKPEYNGKAHVIPIAGTDDVCRVTTEDGTIVSTISTQAKSLRAAFDDLRD